MGQANLDLKREQRASMARPRYQYSLASRLFFLAMDLVAGRKTTLAKAKLLEILAGIPYREWETRQYDRMTQGYRNPGTVQRARQIVAWGREAQDNEYWHLLVIQEKMKTDRLSDPWYLAPPVAWLIVRSYRVIAERLGLKDKTQRDGRTYFHGVSGCCTLVAVRLGEYTYCAVAMSDLGADKLVDLLGRLVN